MSLSDPNLPELIVSLRLYNAQMFFPDLLVGIAVGLVALPLAMAFWHRLGIHSTGRPLRRRHRRLPHLYPWRLESPDRRAHRCMRRHGGRHHSGLLS